MNIKNKFILSLLLCSSLVGCSKPEVETVFENKDISTNSGNDVIKIYNTEEEIVNLKEEIGELIQTVPVSMEEYYVFKNKVLSYVDSSLKFYGNLDNVISLNNEIMSSKLIKIDQDLDGVPDLYEIFIAGTSPFRKISDERTAKNDGTKQNKVYLYSYGDGTTSILFGDIISKNVKQGYLNLGDSVYFDLFLRSNELQSLNIKCNKRTGKNEYPISFTIEGLYTPTVRGTATFYHHNKVVPETNYIVYNNTIDDYLERSKEYTRTVSELFTNTEYILVN